LLSLLLVLVYFIGTVMTAGAISALKLLAAMLVPLACIWFPEAMGFLGWIVLLLPLMVIAILWLQGVRLDGSLD
jgi:hypothetical protein